MTPVTMALDELNIPYRIFTHAARINSLEEAAAERGQSPDQIVRSLVFRIAQDEFVMVLMAGPGRVSWPALRKHLGQSRLTTATEEELLAATGYEHGAAAPFGLPRPMRILIDVSIQTQNEISLGSGVRDTAILMTSNDLVRALPHAEFGSFGKPIDKS